MNAEITYRQAVATDAPFFYAVIDQTMREFIVATWGAWNEERVLRESLEDSSSLNAKVVQRKGQDIGVLLVEELPSHFQVQQVYLLPPFQRQGVGTELVSILVKNAVAVGKPVRLRVLKVNSAKQFYEKLSFVVTGEDKEFFQMERAV
jgi:ribosomal protein S18 acetylase RimI-like enzyme